MTFLLEEALITTGAYLAIAGTELPTLEKWVIDPQHLSYSGSPEAFEERCSGSKISTSCRGLFMQGSLMGARDAAISAAVQPHPNCFYFHVYGMTLRADKDSSDESAEQNGARLVLAELQLNRDDQQLVSLSVSAQSLDQIASATGLSVTALVRRIIAVLEQKTQVGSEASRGAARIACSSWNEFMRSIV